jgi:hypothetical protein
MKRLRIPRSVSGSETLDLRTLAAFREACRTWRGRPGVTGISMSIKQRDGTLVAGSDVVITIHVAQKLDRKRLRGEGVPPTILGVPTDVIEVQYSREHGAEGAAGPSPSPLIPGASVGRVGGTAASFGAVVRDANGHSYMLCAAHTLREGGRGKKGDIVVHPGPSDAQGVTCREVATYERVHFGMDAGLARLLPGIAAANALPDGAEIEPPAAAAIGDVLRKHGRSTGTTTAIVQGIGLCDNVFPAMLLRRLDADGSPHPISERGDSGAVWYDSTTRHAKGLHFAGSGAAPRATEYAAASLIPSVVKHFKVRWP